MKKNKKKKKAKSKKQDNMLLIILVLLLGIACAVVCVFVITKKLSVTEQMQIHDTRQAEPQVDRFQDFKKYRFVYKYTLNVSGKIRHLEFTLPIPQNQKNAQYLSNLKLNPKPEKLYKQNGNLIANFSFDNVTSGPIDIVLQGNANLKTYYIDSAKQFKQNNDKEEDLTPYLQSEKYIESDDEYIKNIADSIKGASEEEILQNMYEYIQKHMQYKTVPQNLGAKKALGLGYGKCSEYAAIMVALCRAKGIPARIAFGNFAREKNTKHSWVEVYFNEYGWVTYDPTILPTEMTIYNSDKTVASKNIIYEVSHKDVHYIKSGITLFSPYFIKYSASSQSAGKISVSENISIKE